MPSASAALLHCARCMRVMPAGRESSSDRCWSLFASFSHEGAAYDLAATALSLWGGADASGAPDRAAAPLTAELLVFFGLSGTPCRTVHKEVRAVRRGCAAERDRREPRAAETHGLVNLVRKPLQRARTPATTKMSRVWA